MTFDLNSLKSVTIGLASPERVLEWSKGEVTKPETINYRSHKPVADGLFCEKIFGPTKDYECSCGKTKRTKSRATRCEKCGVDITTRAVRRERLGHIALASPCSHIWYFKGNPSRVALLLNVSPKKLQEVAYYASRIVLSAGTCKNLQKCEILDEQTIREKFGIIVDDIIDNNIVTDKYDLEDLERYRTLLHDTKAPFSFEDLSYLINKYTHAEFGMGAEAILRLLEELDIEKEFQACQKNIYDTIAKNKAKGKKKISKDGYKPIAPDEVKRLEVLKSFHQSKQNPCWMILKNLPVIPPDLRPMLQLDGGRFATSDLNELYRTVIIRNERVKKFMNGAAPDPILINEKRMLQDAVDALLDNDKRNKPSASSSRIYKSLSDSLKGKEGRFRQNLLGKRVDYSGRSVIAVGPTLRMNECGIPREMALQLFKPFIIHELVSSSDEDNPMGEKAAAELVERYDPRASEALEKIIKDHYVLLNRAPTLHRLGIQAFKPVIVEGRAIRLHPLVCTGFNADFDGDQMAVHIPLGYKANQEAENLMIANHNILGPKDGKPICIPTQDMVLGNYYLTMELTKNEFETIAKEYRELGDNEVANNYDNYKNLEGKVFFSVDDVLLAYKTRQIHIHNRIALKASSLKKTNLTDEQRNAFLVTTVGKVIFNMIFPEDFPYINDATNVKNGTNLKANLDEYFVNIGTHEDLHSSIKCVTDIKKYIESLPVRKPICKSHLGDLISKVFALYKAEKTSHILDAIKDAGFEFSTIAGFTVSIDDMRVVEDKKELLHEADLKVNEIEENYANGLLDDKGRYNEVISVWEDTKDKIKSRLQHSLDVELRNPIFLMANSGARGSLGNFVSLLGMQGLMVSPKGDIIEIPIRSNFREGSSVSEFFIGSHGARKGGTDTALKTADSGYLTRRLIDVSHNVIIREEKCGCDHGLVVSDLYSGDKDNKIIVSLKDRIIGRYSMNDIYNEETDELIVPEDTMITEELAQKIVDAGIKEVEIRSLLTCTAKSGVCRHCYGKNMATGDDAQLGDAVGIMAAQSIGEPGTQLTLKNFHSGGTTGADITQGLPRVQELIEARKPKGVAVITQIPGVVEKIVDVDGLGSRYIISVTNPLSHETREYQTPFDANLVVKEGDTVKAGQQLTQGSINPNELMSVCGVRKTQEYIIREVLKVYASQNIGISDKHIEVIVRQMTRKGMIVDGGDTELLPGMKCDMNDFTATNKKMFEENLRPAKIQPVLLGITKAALDTKGFLSAASFQETTKILTSAAINLEVDNLEGLKENVMVGKLIPAGTGIKDLPSFKYAPSNADYAKPFDVTEEDLNRFTEETESTAEQLSEGSFSIEEGEEKLIK